MESSMELRRHWLGVALAALPLAAFAGSNAGDASTQAEGNATLEQRLQQAEDSIRILERKLEVSDEAAATAAKSTAVVKASTSGFSIASADNSMVLRLRANIAVDYRDFLDDYTPSTADTFLIRRARPTFEGTVADIYDFRLMPDFGQGKAIIQDAWISARVQPWLAVQAGKFKAPVGLERLQLEQFARFVESALPSDLLPYRDIGVQLVGGIRNGLLSYSAGYFDGTVDGTSTDSNVPTPDQDNDGKKDWEARLFSQPFANSDHFALRGFGIGLGGTYVRSNGIATSSPTSVTTTTLLPTYKTPGQQQLFSYRGDDASTPTVNEATIAAGVRRRWAPQAYYYYGPFGVMTEYSEVTQQVRRQLDATHARFGTLTHHGWMFEASWFVTGEEESYAGFTPRSVFKPGHGIGAWELVARYHEIDFDPDSFTGGAASFASPNNSPKAAHAVGGGVNWYLNQNVKLQAMYEVTSYQGGLKSGDRPSEEVLTTRFALVF